MNSSIMVPHSTRSSMT